MPEPQPKDGYFLGCEWAKVMFEAAVVVIKEERTVPNKLAIAMHLLYLFVETKLYLDHELGEMVMVPRHCIVGKANAFLQSVSYFIGVGANLFKSNQLPLPLLNTGPVGLGGIIVEDLKKAGKVLALKMPVKRKTTFSSTFHCIDNSMIYGMDVNCRCLVKQGETAC